MMANTAIVGEVLGLVMVGTTILLGLWLRRRRRAFVEEEPPLRAKLLRASGHSLQKRLIELNTKLDDIALWVGASGTLAGVVGATIGLLLWKAWRGAQTNDLFGNSHFWGIVLTCGAMLVWNAASFRSFFRVMEKIKSSRLGLRGEQAVAEALGQRSLLEAGYITFHDVPGDGQWNIDHVTVGPGGVFVIETKTRSRRKSNTDQKKHVVVYDGRTLHFPWGHDHNATRQAERNAEWVRRFLGRECPQHLEAQPLIVVPGWYVESNADHKLKVMNQTYLTRFLQGQPKRFSNEELVPILEKLDARCRNVEF